MAGAALHERGGLGRWSHFRKCIKCVGEQVAIPLGNPVIPRSSASFLTPGHELFPKCPRWKLNLLPPRFWPTGGTHSGGTRKHTGRLYPPPMGAGQVLACRARGAALVPWEGAPGCHPNAGGGHRSPSQVSVPRGGQGT